MPNTRQEQIMEYIKCTKNPVHTIESYMETFDKTQDGYVPFKLFPRQKEIIHGYDNERFNMVLKYRQAGITTITAAYGASITTFSDPKNPEKILIIANKQETAKEFLSKMVTFIKQIPDWAFETTKDKDGRDVPIYFTKESAAHVKMPNGAEIKAVGTSKDALRGYTPTIIIFDEAAFIEGGADLWAACTASVSTGGKIFLISTPNGQDQIYYKSYNDTIKGKGSFNIVSIKWWEDPRYRKNIQMVKCEDAVDWIGKPAVDRTEEIIDIPKEIWSEVEDFNAKYIHDYIAKGYKPISPWYISMCKLFNLNKRLIAQELECVIGDTYITVKNRNTGLIEEIKVEELYNRL